MLEDCLYMKSMFFVCYILSLKTVNLPSNLADLQKISSQFQNIDSTVFPSSVYYGCVRQRRFPLPKDFPEKGAERPDVAGQRAFDAIAADVHGDGAAPRTEAASSVRFLLWS